MLGRWYGSSRGKELGNNAFFEHPILNSPYEYPAQHRELDADGQPTQRVMDSRRPADFITPIPKSKRRRGQATQGNLDAMVEVASQSAETRSVA